MLALPLTSALVYDEVLGLDYLGRPRIEREMKCRSFKNKKSFGAGTSCS